MTNFYWDLPLHLKRAGVTFTHIFLSVMFYTGNISSNSYVFT